MSSKGLIRLSRRLAYISDHPDPRTSWHIECPSLSVPTTTSQWKMACLAGAVAGCLLVLVAMALLVTVVLSGDGTVTNSEEALALDMELEYAAIQAVLRHLDDNHDGSVDFQESEEFVQMELHETSEKSQRFHETDSQITSEDLWQSWQQNDVFHWTNADVVQWLVVSVELPQYKTIFCKLNISGRHLPRLANNTGGILQSLLGITDSQHKQKLRLRAMDLVLFGPPNGKTSLWKDVVVALSVSLCVVGVVYALRQRRVTEQRIDKFLESFREKERQLKALQERLEEQNDGGSERGEGREGEGDSSSSKSPPESSPSPESEMSLPPFSRNLSRCSSFDSSLARAQEQIAMLQREVADLNSQLASHTISQSILQSLLQDSCRNEREHVERQRVEAQDEITRAQRVCDKIKRRRSSLFGTFHLANSSALEEAGLQITRAVNNMQNVSESFEEYHQRWRRIEQVCNFPVVSVTHGLASTTVSFSLPRDTSSNSLKSMEEERGKRSGSADNGPSFNARDSFSRHSEGYGSSDASVTSFTPNGSPRSSLTSRRGRFGVSGSSSLERETAPTSSSSLYSHRFSSQSLNSAVSRGRANTLPPTSSLPRNFTISGRLVSRHDSYNEAVESERNSLNGLVSMASDRGKGRRMSDSGCERMTAMREAGARRNSIKRQAAGLSAVHEETTDPRTESGVEPVAVSTTTAATARMRGGVTRTSTSSTV